MFCSRCGTENVDNAKYCQNCGELLKPKGPKYYFILTIKTVIGMIIAYILGGIYAYFAFLLLFGPH